MLGADVSVVERLGFLGGESQNLFNARSVGNIADHFLIGTRADLLFDLHANRFQIEAEFLENVNGDALAELDQTEQQMLGAHKIVVKPVGLFTRQGQNLLGPRRKVVHGFIAHIYTY